MKSQKGNVCCVLPGCRVPHNGPVRLGEETTAAPRWDGPGKWHGKSSKPGLLAAPHSTSRRGKRCNTAPSPSNTRVAPLLSWRLMSVDVSWKCEPCPSWVMGSTSQAGNWFFVSLLTCDRHRTSILQPHIRSGHPRCW